MKIGVLAVMLEKKERLLLINQYLILEKLDPENASDYEEIRVALEYGYEDEYKHFIEELRDPMTETECGIVQDTLNLYRVLTFSYNLLESPTDLTQEDIAFQGFDGNNEGNLYSYAKYLMETRLLYQELPENPHHAFNSHRRMQSKYIAMLQEFEIMKKDGADMLSEDEIKKILKAR